MKDYVQMMKIIQYCKTKGKDKKRYYEPKLL